MVEKEEDDNEDIDEEEEEEEEDWWKLVWPSQPDDLVEPFGDFASINFPHKQKHTQWMNKLS
jgi:hypothetical protein